MRSPIHVSTGPWGMVAGLLMFCFVSLCGIVFQVDPFVIAQRAIFSSVVTCFVSQFTAYIMTMTLSRKHRR